MILHDEALTADLYGKVFHIVHGHGLATDSRAYRILLWIFRNRFIRLLYSSIHPGFSVALGQRWSRDSRLGKGYSHQFKGEENESLFTYAKEVLSKQPIDCFVFGHRHLALDYTLKEGGRIVILGNWFNEPCYLEWDGKEIKLTDFSYH